MLFSSWCFFRKWWLSSIFFLGVKLSLHYKELCFLLIIPTEIRLFQSLNYQGPRRCSTKSRAAIIWHLIPLPPYYRKLECSFRKDFNSCVRFRRLLKSQCINFSNFHSFLLCIRRRGSNSMNFGAACFK